MFAVLEDSVFRITSNYNPKYLERTQFKFLFSDYCLKPKFRFVIENSSGIRAIFNGESIFTLLKKKNMSSVLALFRIDLSSLQHNARTSLKRRAMTIDYTDHLKTTPSFSGGVPSLLII